jgi:hypothetical protein
VVALASFDVPPLRKPGWMDEAEVVREERERERDEDNQRFEDFDADRHYAYGESE